MLKDSEISIHSGRRTHRTYTPQFKAELVAACQHPGASIAALAGQHGMNAKVLHCWLKEHQRSGCHQLAEPGKRAIGGVQHQSPAFIALTLSPEPPTHTRHEIKIELRNGALSMVVTWPMSATADLASRTAALLK